MFNVLERERERAAGNAALALETFENDERMPQRLDHLQADNQALHRRVAALELENSLLLQRIEQVEIMFSSLLADSNEANDAPPKARANEHGVHESHNGGFEDGSNSENL